MSANNTPSTSPCILHVEDEEADIYLLRFAFQHAGITPLACRH